jgi:Zinc knuckle
MDHGAEIGLGTTGSSHSTMQSAPESNPSFPSSSTEPSNSSAPRELSSNTPVSGTDPPGENERTQVLQELEDSVNSFRDHKTSKTETISSILRILGEISNVSITQSQKDATFDSYLTEILSIQSARDRANESQSTGESSTKPNTGISDSNPGRIHDRSESESDDEDDCQSVKRRKLLESDMPWYSPTNESSPSHSNPSCVETCRLLRAYNHDISKAKFFVRIAPNSPSGIPSSQWERILRGEAVDLNHVFASLHHVVPDEERTGRLGDAEISFGVTEPKKRISTASEWCATWRRASKAISFAFPHRRDELLDYGDYIESEFAAKVVSSHHKLLLYDVALRNEVAAGQQFLLTDYNRFSRLYSAIVLPDGVESQSSTSTGTGKKPGKSGQTGNKPEVCNKFNSGTCKNSDLECKYRHLCKNCNKPGHVKKDCGVKEGTN